MEEEASNLAVLKGSLTDFRNSCFWRKGDYWSNDGNARNDCRHISVLRGGFMKLVDGLFQHLGNQLLTVKAKAFFLKDF